MPDDLVDLEALLTQTANATPQELQALLPAATNPGAHAPAQGANTTADIIAKQLADQPAPTEAPATETPAASSEPEIETETQTEQEPEVAQISPQDALFEELRIRFPNESLVKLAARAEAAFSADTHEQSDAEQVDVLAEIQADYDSRIQEAKEAEDAVKALLNPEDGTIAEYTSEIRDAERAAMKASFAAEGAFKALAEEANAIVEAEFPELTDENSQAFQALLGVLEVNPTLPDSSPVALANLGRHIASKIRAATPAPAAAAPAKTFASPTRVPAPAGPKPPVAGLSSGVQASHASAATPAPGAQQGNDVVSKIRGAGSIDDLEAMFFGKGLKSTVLS